MEEGGLFAAVLAADPRQSGRDTDVVGGAERVDEQAARELVAVERIADDAATILAYTADLDSTQCSKKWSSSSGFKLWSWL